VGHSVTLGGLGFFAGLLFCAAVAPGQTYYSTLSGGYSNLTVQHAGAGEFYDHNGPYIDADIGWRLPNPDFPLLIGIGFTGSGYWDNQNVTVPVENNTALAQGTLYSDVGLFELEPRLALALWSANMPGMFLKPRIGAGLLIDNYAIDHTVTTATGNSFINTEYFTGAAFEVRPAVQAGYSWGPGAIGAEISYMAAWGDFGRLGDDAQEFRAGVFFTLRF
jgi:hypothetical protein